jgi:hypothetical protein
LLALKNLFCYNNVNSVVFKNKEAKMQEQLTAGGLIAIGLAIILFAVVARWLLKKASQRKVKKLGG